MQPITVANVGGFTYAGKDITWTRQGRRVSSNTVTHPSGKPIRFRSVGHLERHVTNMRGKALTHTHKPCRSAQKSRRNRGGKR